MVLHTSSGVPNTLCHIMIFQFWLWIIRCRESKAFQRTFTWEECQQRSTVRSGNRCRSNMCTESPCYISGEYTPLWKGICSLNYAYCLRIMYIWDVSIWTQTWSVTSLLWRREVVVMFNKWIFDEYCKIIFGASEWWLLIAAWASGLITRVIPSCYIWLQGFLHPFFNTMSPLHMIGLS
jgi:hypothetical protein